MGLPYVASEHCMAMVPGGHCPLPRSSSPLDTQERRVDCHRRWHPGIRHMAGPGHATRSTSSLGFREARRPLLVQPRYCLRGMPPAGRHTKGHLLVLGARPTALTPSSPRSAMGPPVVHFLSAGHPRDTLPPSGQSECVMSYPSISHQIGSPPTRDGE